MNESAGSRTGSTILLAVGVALAFATVLGIVLWRDREQPAPASLADLVASSDPGPIHVHGLGINPRDGALLVATHTGLWRSALGEQKAERVTDRLQDTMGFAVVGRDHFVGSGHPDPREARAQGLPSQLGLIESRDAGKSWSQISLVGKADFHILRTARERVYGFDSTSRRLMVSTDSGRSWRSRRPPATLHDLVVDPANGSHIAASGAGGLWESRDEGRRWRWLGDGLGYLGWPDTNRLYLVTLSGAVRMKNGLSRRWRTVGRVEGEPAALVVTKGDELYVALHDGTIVHSQDGGRTWAIRSRP